jgi:hypothetical protein
MAVSLLTRPEAPGLFGNKTLSDRHLRTVRFTTTAVTLPA